jgi:signal peptidase I
MFPLRTRTDAAPAAPSSEEGGLVRQLVESVIVLAVAVLSFRAFLAEGYLISTGSMAPSLLGYHKQVECPDCHLRFAAGVADRESNSPAREVKAQDLVGDDYAYEPSAICPNCGYDHIPLADFPRNEGDQLMVHKHAYQFRDPRRWEVIVFDNPADPVQAYVKRVVGLPGDLIEVIDGDVWANGQLQRKPLSAQQGCRILVDDHSHQPSEDAEWQPRWFASSGQTRWRAEGTAFVFEPARDVEAAVARESDQPDALTFRHWIRRGGRHVTTVPLDHWPIGIGPPPAVGESIQYVAQALSCIGVLSEAEIDRWKSRSTAPEFHAAVDALALASHEAPIMDEYGYNRPDEDQSFVVRDLMVEFDLDIVDRDGRFETSIDDGRRRYTASLDFDELHGRICSDESTTAIESSLLQKEILERPLHVEMSLMDRQALLAVNGRLVFPAVETSGTGQGEPAPRRPIQLVATGGTFRVSNLRVYRDVYYTPKSEKREPRRLGEDEFFVLGDNSPVSIDSRSWDDPAVHRHDLVGKPFIVHLPSQQGTLTLLGKTRHVRIPDFSRVRYIR